MSIAYQVHGDGLVEIVFVPGVVLHVDLLEAAACGLFFVGPTSFDGWSSTTSGARASGPDGATTTLDDSMDDLKAVMEAAGCGSAVVFASRGRADVALAATHPDLVSSSSFMVTYV